MKLRKILVRAAVSMGLVAAPVVPVFADVPSVPPLFIREIKITGDEFVVVQANQDVTLSDYWLGYGSSNTATGIVPTVQLPAQKLLQGQVLLLTSDGAPTCDAVLVSKLPVSLGDSKGTLVLRQLQSSGNSSTFTTIDSVAWSTSTSKITTTDPIDMSKQGALSYPVWYHQAVDASAWQLGDFAACTLTIAPTSGPDVTSVTWLQNDSDPPAIIESLADDDQPSGPYLPSGDVGLLPPQITELLPNPAGTGTDDTDEFIELYNPNGVNFDLSGFKLQTGLTTKHTYTFPVGTTLPPRGFVAFYSADSGLTLSNTSGQADLQDPFGTVIAQTDAYNVAKDGTAWALAKGAWYWTAKPTPNAANVINQVSSSSVKTTSTKKAAAAVKGASTTKTPLQGAVTTTADANTTKSTPIHPYILAAVVVLAVGYGVYEYRHDIANRFHQFRANRKAR